VKPASRAFSHSPAVSLMVMTRGEVTYPVCDEHHAQGRRWLRERRSILSHADLWIEPAMFGGKRGQPFPLIQGDHRTPPLGERQRHLPRTPYGGLPCRSRPTA
jgi:hypothetical protein